MICLDATRTAERDQKVVGEGSLRVEMCRLRLEDGQLGVCLERECA